MSLDRSSSSNLPVSTNAAYLLMLLTVAIFASAFAGIRYMLDRVDVMTFSALRLTIASAGFLLGAVVARVPLPRREHLGRLIAAGLCGFTLYHVFLNFGASRITAGQAAFVTSTIPVWTAFAAWRALGEQVTPRHWLGLAVSLSGIAVMSLQPGDANLGVGSALVVLAAIMAAANIVLQKGLVEQYRPFDLSVYVALLGSLPLVAWLPTRASALTTLTSTDWAVVTYLGLVPIVLGYWLSTIALKALPAYRTSQFLLLISPLAALIAWGTLGEVPPTRTLFGGAIVLVGVALTVRRRRAAAQSLRPPY